MSEVQRHNGLDPDPEGAFVYYDEYETLRDERDRLQRALRNCHMLARRVVASESAFFKIDSANHIIRICEEVGVTSAKGVLKQAALTPAGGGKE